MIDPGSRFDEYQDERDCQESSVLGPLDAFGHFINLVLPALGVASGLALAAKIVWRAELVAVPWIRMFAAGAAAGVAAILASIVMFGRDGTLAGYALLVLSCAVSLWWQCFGPGRR